MGTSSLDIESCLIAKNGTGQGLALASAPGGVVTASISNCTIDNNLGGGFSIAAGGGSATIFSRGQNTLIGNGANTGSLSPGSDPRYSGASGLASSLPFTQRRVIVNRKYWRFEIQKLGWDCMVIARLQSLRESLFLVFA
jgi:hypothetical protein